MEEKTYPKLRQVNIFPTEVSGERFFCLQDPLHFTPYVFTFPYPAFFIISLCDGKHSLVDIQAEFLRHFGKLIYRDKIQEVVDQLEENLLLEGDRFRAAEAKSLDDFRKAPMRPMALAGEAYPEDPEKLREQIKGYFAEPDGPGLPGLNGSDRDVIGAIAPHIDYRRGGPCYAWTHRAIRESSPADLFIILGTAHSPLRQPYTFTRKDFQTPFGPVESDRTFLSALEAACPFDPYEDEFAHKAEHSIELQLVFLRALWPKQDRFQIVPILCGSFQEAILKGISPGDLPGVGPFLKALKTAVESSSKRICLLASADLAHVGRQFGDAEAPNRFSLQDLSDQDLALLEFAEGRDAEGFYRVLQEENDQRRICGLSPIYTLLHCLGPGPGKLLAYKQSTDPATQSAVTFAGMAFYP